MLCRNMSVCPGERLVSGNNSFAVIYISTHNDLERPTTRRTTNRHVAAWGWQSEWLGVFAKFFPKH